MRQLAIDMGNTRVKAGVFSSDQLIKVLDKIDPQELPQIVVQEEIEEVIISSVVNDFENFKGRLGLKQFAQVDPRSGYSY